MKRMYFPFTKIINKALVSQGELFSEIFEREKTFIFFYIANKNLQIFLSKPENPELH